MLVKQYQRREKDSHSNTRRYFHELLTRSEVVATPGVSLNGEYEIRSDEHSGNMFSLKRHIVKFSSFQENDTDLGSEKKDKQSHASQSSSVEYDSNRQDEIGRKLASNCPSTIVNIAKQENIPEDEITYGFLDDSEQIAPNDESSEASAIDGYQAKEEALGDELSVEDRARASSLESEAEYMDEERQNRNQIQGRFSNTGIGYGPSVVGEKLFEKEVHAIEPEGNIVGDFIVTKKGIYFIEKYTEDPDSASSFSKYPRPLPLKTT